MCPLWRGDKLVTFNSQVKRGYIERPILSDLSQVAERLRATGFYSKLTAATNETMDLPLARR